MYEDKTFIQDIRDDTYLREQLKYSILLVSMVTTRVFYVFIHEWAHLITGLLFGLPLEKFVVTWTSGYVRFGPEILDIGVIERFLIFFSGGFIETLVVIAIANIIWKPYKLMTLASFPYAVLEGGRGILIASNISNQIYYSYMAIIEPICAIFGFLMILVIAYRCFRLEQKSMQRYRSEIYTKIYGL